MSVMNFGSETLRVQFDTETLAFTVTKGALTFPTVTNNPPHFIHHDGQRIDFATATTKEAKIHTSGVGEGVYMEFSGFAELPTFKFAIYLWVEKSIDRLHAEWIPLEEAYDTVAHVHWPQALHCFDPENGYTVLNLMNGKLIPDGSEEEVHPVMSRQLLGREAYMPFWGQVAFGGGYLAVVKTPWDAFYNYHHMPKSPMVIDIEWKHSLARMDYRREIFYQFYDKDCDYVRICKDYRRHVVEHGRFISLSEKILKNPLLGKMVGGCVVHTPFVYKNIVPDSYYYNKEDPSKNVALGMTFDELACKLERLNSLGVENAYVHIDGWGVRGYDNLHPDIFPPCEQAGGWEGMADMVARARKIGFMPAIHDNYRDYYMDAPTFNEDQAQVAADGSFNYDSIWYGGKQRKMCPALSMNYVRRNFEMMHDHNCRPDGAYLDVFSVVELEECANPMHRISRRECVEKRCDCFNYVRSCGMIVSSEEPIDEFVTHLDLVHHAPDFWGKTQGIPVPLFELVYHDSILIPSFTARGVSCAKSDLGYLQCLLQGNIPYLGFNADEKEIERVALLRRFHKEVALHELLSHSFVDGNIRIQESVFASGTRVRVNLDEDTYCITWADGTVTEGKA